MNLNENTTVPLWSVLSSIPFALGAIVWVTALYLNQEAQAKDIHRLESKVEVLMEMKADVVIIKNTVERLEKKSR